MCDQAKKHSTFINDLKIQPNKKETWKLKFFTWLFYWLPWYNHHHHSGYEDIWWSWQFHGGNISFDLIGRGENSVHWLIFLTNIWQIKISRWECQFFPLSPIHKKWSKEENFKNQRWEYQFGYLIGILNI